MNISTISMVIFNSKLLVITMLDNAGTLRFNMIQPTKTGIQFMDKKDSYATG